MKTLSNELRGVIEARLRSASARQVLAIVSALCATELQINREPVPAAAVRSRFTKISVDGEPLPDSATDWSGVEDARTGLIWMRHTLPVGRKSWAEAKKLVTEVDICGAADWRLPTIRELLSIVDYERHDPAIDTSIFQCEGAWYWSSTPYAASPGGFAWYVSFGNGYADWFVQGYYGFVRACRAGQSVEHWF